jgi:hypothetical protein
MTLTFPYHSANEYINTEDNSSSLALDKSGHDGGTQWTCTETSLVGKKWLCNSKKEDHCKLKKRKGLGLVSNFQLGERKKNQN